MTGRLKFIFISLTLGLLVANSRIDAQLPQAIARTFRENNEATILADFREFLSYPNRARNLEDIEEVASYIRDELIQVGVNAELLRIDGVPPIVYGKIVVPGATRTLGIYVHYDGQAVDPNNWTHAPFEPTLYTAAMDAGGTRRPFPEPGDEVDPEWRIYARSAGDDKAPIAALIPVLESFRDSRVMPTSNLVFFFDGEEEAGSRHLGEYMQRWNDRIEDVDIWLFFDGPAHASGRPQVLFGVRGSMGMEVTVYGATRNLHSGHYGNWAPDTGNILATLLASMKDDGGRVRIDGWYDTAEPIGTEELAALQGMPDWDEQLKEELGLVWTEGQPEKLPERLMVPALNVRGITSGNTGALARNVIPNTAVASLGIRLVKGNEPEHMKNLVVSHIEKMGFHVVSEDPDMSLRLKYPRIAKVTGGGGSAAFRTSMANPFAQSVVAAARLAAEQAFGEGALVVAPGMGGTLPLRSFIEVAGKPAIIVPVANHDNNQHAPDENLRIANLWYAIDLYASLLTMPSALF
ncbi:MAG: M20/M25/M40 family metallo-hydrolase [Longimicrobiales bacterium]|nr:M20/M25/M40 family metallo-hydrolase [Longimicrobiales bacterium]